MHICKIHCKYNPLSHSITQFLVLAQSIPKIYVLDTSLSQLFTNILTFLYQNWWCHSTNFIFHLFPITYEEYLSISTTFILAHYFPIQPHPNFSSMFLRIAMLTYRIATKTFIQYHFTLKALSLVYMLYQSNYIF